MYENALTTAGVTDATVTVAGPFNITGTAALVGAMNAYEVQGLYFSDLYLNPPPEKDMVSPLLHLPIHLPERS